MVSFSLDFSFKGLKNILHFFSYEIYMYMYILKHFLLYVQNR